MASPEFKTIVNEWVDLDDQLKEASSDMTEVRKRHKELKEKILEYMDKHDIGIAKIKGGMEELSMNFRDRKIKPKKTEVIKRMADFLQSKEKAVSLYNYIYENCETESTISLSRRVSAKAKKLKREQEKEGGEGGREMEEVTI